jgi:NAD(P)H-flavin reductase
VAFLASSTGLASMMAMLQQYLREGKGHAHVVLGEKQEETIIHRETLDELAAITYHTIDELREDTS